MRITTLQQYFAVFKFPDILLFPCRQLIVSLIRACNDKYI